MSLSDFLFNGSPPPSVTTYGSTTQGLPQWYSDYTQGLAAAGNAIAAEPYTAFGGPRIAGFTQDQIDAQTKGKADIGAFTPALVSGIGTVQNGAEANPLDAASPFLSAASQSAPSVIGDYMNPYTDSVVNRIGELGGRNLQENLMPAIGDQFTRAGQYGSTAMQATTGRALRDTQESTLAAQANALNTGYGQAMTAAQGDLSRIGNLGQVVGNLGSANQSNLINAGTQIGNLSSLGQTMGLKDTAALNDIGAQQQGLNQNNLNTAYSDFIEQRDYPKAQAGFLSNLIRGMQMPISSTTTQTQPTTATSGLAGLASGLTGLSALFGGSK